MTTKATREAVRRELQAYPSLIDIVDEMDAAAGSSSRRGKRSRARLLPDPFTVSASGGQVGTDGPPGSNVDLTVHNLYTGEDGGYLAAYTRDPTGAAYTVGDGIYVAGLFRLRGAYADGVFKPKGFEKADLGADPAMKSLADALFRNRKGGTWAGGDTAGFVASLPEA